MPQYFVGEIALIRELHEKTGFDYRLPDFESRAALATLVRPPVAALHCRIEAEAYLWVDPEATIRARWDAILALSRDCRPILQDKGIEHVVVWVPKPIEDGFAHALVKLGFTKMRPGFSPWCKEL